MRSLSDGRLDNIPEWRNTEWCGVRRTCDLVEHIYDVTGPDGVNLTYAACRKWLVLGTGYGSELDRPPVTTTTSETVGINPGRLRNEEYGDIDIFAKILMRFASSG